MICVRQCPETRLTAASLTPKAQRMKLRTHSVSPLRSTPRGSPRPCVTPSPCAAGTNQHSEVGDWRSGLVNRVNLIQAGLGRFECRECGEVVSERRKCKTCNSAKKAKYVGLRFHDLRRTGVRNMSRKGVPEKVGMLISGHKTDSVYRRYNIVDMEVLKTATAKIEEHQREIVKGENNHGTAIVSTKTGADDKTDPVN